MEVVSSVDVHPLRQLCPGGGWCFHAPAGRMLHRGPRCHPPHSWPPHPPCSLQTPTMILLACIVAVVRGSEESYTLFAAELALKFMKLYQPHDQHLMTDPTPPAPPNEASPIGAGAYFFWAGAPPPPPPSLPPEQSIVSFLMSL